MRKTQIRLPGATENTDMPNPLEDLPIQWQSPRALQSYPRRLRVHNQEQVRRLAASIARYGLDQPLVSDSYGVLIQGRARREAAILLNLATVPVLVREDLIPDQARALRIAANKCAADDWHWNALRDELTELDSAEAADLGFAQDELETLLRCVPPEITFPEYDERVCKDVRSCPYCGGTIVR